LLQNELITSFHTTNALVCKRNSEIKKKERKSKERYIERKKIKKLNREKGQKK